MSISRKEWQNSFDSIQSFVEEYQLDLITVIDAVVGTWDGDYIVEENDAGHVCITKLETVHNAKIRKALDED